METVEGKCSEFGGPNDTGMGPEESVALYTEKSQAPLGLFTGSGVTGRALNPAAMYCAMRWDYDKTPVKYLRGIQVTVTAVKTGKTVLCLPVDWGPNVETGRIIDLSPAAISTLGIDTDDVVTASYSLPGGTAPAISVSPAPSVPGRPVWPLQSECQSFYGYPGTVEKSLVRVPCPWPLKIEGTVQSSILIHKKCADSLKRVLAEIWDRCGDDIKKIAALKYDIYDGTYVDRPMRGSTQTSMHAYGCAIDFDAEDNPFHEAKHLFTPDSIIVEAFEREGWTWGGRWSAASKDWMHFQAARISGADPVPMPPPIPRTPPVVVPTRKPTVTTTTTTTTTTPAAPALPVLPTLVSPALSLIAKFLPAPFGGAVTMILPALPQIIQLVELDAQIAAQVEAQPDLPSQISVLATHFQQVGAMLQEIVGAIAGIPVQAGTVAVPVGAAPLPLSPSFLTELQSLVNALPKPLPSS